MRICFPVRRERTIEEDSESLGILQSLEKLGNQIFVFELLSEQGNATCETTRKSNGSISILSVVNRNTWNEMELGDSELEILFATFLIEHRIELIHFTLLGKGIPISLVETALRTGARTVCAANDMALGCLRGILTDATGKPCSGPENLEKCLECLAGTSDEQNEQLALQVPDWAQIIQKILSRCSLITYSKSEHLPLLQEGSLIPLEGAQLIDESMELQFISHPPDTGPGNGSKPITQPPPPERISQFWHDTYCSLYQTQDATDYQLAISVILIPPYKPEELLKCLESFSRQTMDKSMFELLLFDRGDIELNHILDSFQSELNLQIIPVSAELPLAELVYLGGKNAQHMITLPFFSDYVPGPQLLLEHAKAHALFPQKNVAIRGSCVHHPTLARTAIMHLAEERGEEPFVSSLLTDSLPLSWAHFCLGTTSLKRELISEEEMLDDCASSLLGFDFAFRLRRVGLSVVINRQALSYLTKPVTLDRLIEMARECGKAAHYVLLKHKAQPSIFQALGMEDYPRFLRLTDNPHNRYCSIIGPICESPLSEFRTSITTINSANMLNSNILSGSLALVLSYEKQAALAASGYSEDHAVSFSASDRINNSEKPRPPILLFSRLLPSPDSPSRCQRFYQIIRLLRAEGYPVTLLTLEFKGDEHDRRSLTYLQQINVAAYPSDPRRTLEHSGIRSLALTTNLHSILIERPYRFAFFADIESVDAFLPALRRFAPQARIIADLSQLPSLRLSKSGRNIYSCEMLPETLRDSCDCFISAVPGVLLDSESTTETLLLPPSIDENLPVAPFSARRDILFYADFSNSVTQKALSSFLQRLWYKIRERVSDARLILLGDSPPPELRLLARKEGILVEDYATEPALYLQRSRVAVLPDPVVADSWEYLTELRAAGLPVVTTRNAASALGLADEHGLVVAETEEEFVEALFLLYEEEKHWAAHSAKIRQSAETEFPKKRAEDMLRELLENTGNGVDQASSALNLDHSSVDFRVGIVIPLFNQLEFTKTCLLSLFRHTSPEISYQLILVDNGSTDGTADYLKQFVTECDNVEVITNPQNRGFAVACNQGAVASKSEYLLLLNNDTELHPGWLEPLVEILDSDAEAGAVGAKLLYPDGTIQHAGMVMLDNERANPFQPAHIFRGHPGNHPQVNIRRKYRAVTGACLMVRRELFFRVGGLDEQYWNGCEDVDLCFKLQDLGYSCVYEPSSVVVHHEAKSGPERFRREDANVARLQLKWGSSILPEIRENVDGSWHIIDTELFE